MRNKAELSGISMDHIIKRERAMLTRTFVFLYLFVFTYTCTSAESQGCTDSTVTRVSFGDRIVFYNYAGTCNKGINPCKQVNGVWRNSVRNNCTCQCLRANSAYREDIKSCVKNDQSRDGCTMLFDRERNTYSLRVFNKSSSLKLNTLPRENCRVTGTAYVIAYGTAVWKQFKASQMPFYIRHDRKRNRHDHFLKWKGDPVAELLGKIVKVDIECQKTRGPGSDTLKQLCIVFKVKGTNNLPCPVVTTSSPTLMTTIPKTTELHISNQTTKKPLGPSLTDVVTVIIDKPNTTPDPSIIDGGNKQSHDVGSKKAGLPIWLIAVVAGGAVIATLCITVIIWLCWKMKRRSHKRRTTRRAKLGNSLCNPDDDSVIAFAPSGGGPGIDEAGYARVVNPTGRKGYAYLKPAPERRSRCEYQKLNLKPTEDRSGYLLPLEEVTTATNSPSASNIYSEAQCPKPPQNKPKSKDYDYAKPEGIIVLSASRSSLDNLDSHRDTDSKPNEADYVETREQNGPSSPLYAVVEGPNSPPLKSPGVPSEGASLENELNDPAADYIEVLPDTENVNKDSET